MVPQLLDAGHEVSVFDRFVFGDEPLRGALGDRECGILHGDMRRIDAGMFEGVDTVVHLAGLSNDPSCDLDAEMAIDVNLAGTRDLIAGAAAAGVKRMVLVSSCSVYGQGVVEALDEQSPTNPVSVYARTKLDSEDALRELSGDRMEWVVARPATLFGWSPRMRFDLAINQMTATAVRTKKINIYGGGKQWRPFVHVRDAARALQMMAEAPAKIVNGEVFNLGTDETNIRIIDLAERVAELLGGIELVVEKADDDTRTYNVRFEKIVDALGFTCEWPIDRGALEIRDQLESNDIDPFSSKYFNVQRMKELLAKPVADGGEPIAPRYIGLAPPNIGEEEERAIIDVMRSGWLTTGAKVSEFEKAFADTVSAKHAVAVSSCTAALHVCLAQAGVGPGDEVITSPITWPSTANTVVNMGAKLVLADVCADTLNINPETVRAAITDKTKAIMPVHLAGQPCDMEAIDAIAKEHGIAVVQDAAHGLGAAYGGTPIGGQASPACFSFYPVKNITTIEGGMIALEDEAQAEELRLLANNGMSSLAWKRYGPDAAASPPEVVRPGFKYNMTNVGAAMGLVQLGKLSGFMSARRRLVRLYKAALSDVEEVTMPKVIEGVTHSWHLMIVRLDLAKLSKSRDEIALALKQENVGTGVHFLAVHLHEYYRDKLGYAESDLPEATAASNAILSLPLHPGMSDKNVREVVDALKKVLSFSRA
jgi:dTDP-4-amino-4,6-dideoxygalactose transaminase/nucleoside-diphosphate-sugar epimerase